MDFLREVVENPNFLISKILEAFFPQKGGVEKRELELGERMSNEAVDINPEEYKSVTGGINHYS